MSDTKSEAASSKSLRGRAAGGGPSSKKKGGFSFKKKGGRPELSNASLVDEPFTDAPRSGDLGHIDDSAMEYPKNAFRVFKDMLSGKGYSPVAFRCVLTKTGELLKDDKDFNKVTDEIRTLHGMLATVMTKLTDDNEGLKELRKVKASAEKDSKETYEKYVKAEYKDVLSMELQQIDTQLQVIQKMEADYVAKIQRSTTQRNELKMKLQQLEKASVVQDTAFLQMARMVDSVSEITMTAEDAVEARGLINKVAKRPFNISAEDCIAPAIVSGLDGDGVTDEKAILTAIYETFALKFLGGGQKKYISGRIIADIDKMTAALGERYAITKKENYKFLSQEEKRDRLLSRSDLTYAENPLITILKQLNAIVRAGLDVPLMTSYLGVPVSGAVETIYKKWASYKGQRVLNSLDLFDLFEPVIISAELSLNGSSLYAIEDVMGKSSPNDDDED
jgi:hypothetical protein